MSDQNGGRVRPLLRSVLGRIIRDHVELRFINQTVRSRDRGFEITLPERVRDIPRLGVPGQPHGLYQVFISPERYRPKSVFVSVPSRRTLDMDLDFFIRPDRARPRFPSFETLQENEEWADLARVLAASSLDERQYQDLGPLQKGSLFNLHAKMHDQEVASGAPVFSFVRRIVKIEEERVFWRADPALLAQTREHETGFHSAPGTLHVGFSDGFERVASFKTYEKVGNLQLTFAQDAAGQLEVDADLDDHQGIKHAFDVLRHRITGDKTHPFDIHQVLIRFHEIDPGYDLV